MAKKKKRPAKQRAARRPAKKSGRKKVGAKKPAASGLAALARQIVRLTEAPSFDEERAFALYATDCVSEESTGTVARGHAGLTEKNAGWRQMQTGSRWKATQVWLGPKSICIEWEGVVDLRDGRTVTLQEVAVHEVRNGKIQSERYYYNPMVLAPPTS
jgi:ketosteroid isomerase-like protein